VSKMNKQARRLYVGNLPDTTEQELGDFFNEVMRVKILICCWFVGILNNVLDCPGKQA
jgi:hypothetical protein